MIPGVHDICTERKKKQLATKQFPSTKKKKIYNSPLIVVDLLGGRGRAKKTVQLSISARRVGVMAPRLSFCVTYGPSCPTVTPETGSHNGNSRLYLVWGTLQSSCVSFSHFFFFYFLKKGFFLCVLSFIPPYRNSGWIFFLLSSNGFDFFLLISFNPLNVNNWN